MSTGQGRHNRTTVDWHRIDRELNCIPSDFRAPRFDSLKHVVEILGSVDPKDSVEELKEAKNRLEGLIDQVVDVYHNGFNLAIQNYSQILQLFTESRDQVDALRLALTDSRRRLGAQSRTLRKQWKRNEKLDYITKMLHDVQAVVDVPSKIDGHQLRKDWPRAVALLLEGCGRVGREELTKVCALRKIKDDLGTRWRMLQSQITAEIQKRVYDGEVIDRDGFGVAGVRTPGKGAQRRKGSLSAGHTPRHSRKSSLGSFSERDSLGGSLRGASFTLRRKWSSGDDDKSDVSDTLSLRDLVDCIAQMGCMSELKQTISKNMASKIKGAIVKAIQSIEGENGPQRDAALGTPVSSPVTQGFSIPTEVSTSAKTLLTVVCTRVLQILQNLIRLFEIISKADATFGSAAIQFLRSHFEEQQQQLMSMRLGQQDAAPNSPSSTENEGKVESLSGGKFLDVACLDAWKCVQGEVLQLVALVLGVPLRQLDKGKPEVQSWLARLDDRVGKAKNKGVGEANERKSKMTFSFGIVLDGGSPREVSNVGKNAGKETLSYAGLVEGTLNHLGGPYLTPTLYKAIMEFVDSCQKAMHEALEKFEEGMADTGDALKPAHHRLRDFVENFVMETFLPQVWVDFRGRVTALLEDQEAFRPQARSRSSVRTNNGTLIPGDSVLRAATVAERMIKEVSGWASSMPPFASSLTGVIENILGRVQEAFSLHVQKALGEAFCGKLASNQDITALMAQEADAALIPDPAAFYLLNQGDSLDQTLGPNPSPSPTPSSAESNFAENEIIKGVLKERPIPQEGLIARPGQFGRMIELATLSNSLEFVAGSISGLLRRPDFPSSPVGASGNFEPFGAKSRGRLKTRQISVAWQDGLFGSLGLLTDRYRALAGLCIRALRLEMVCLVVHYLDELTAISHLCEDEDRKEVPSAIGSLIRHAARVEEELAPHLPMHKRKYSLGLLCTACAKVAMWLLPDFKEMNFVGVERMNRLLSMLQPALSSFMTSNLGGSNSGSYRLFDNSRSYYSMLNMGVADLLAYANKKPNKFSASEWKVLLEVHIPGRWVSEEHIQAMEKVLEHAGESRSSKRSHASGLRRSKGPSRH